MSANRQGVRFLLALVLIMCVGLACPQQTPNPDGDGSEPTPTPTPASNPDAIGGVEAERLRSTDFSYQGAFRLPEDFDWGARGLAFYPDGAGGAGTLLVTGFELLHDPAHGRQTCWDASWNCQAYYGEVAIPEPARAENWEDLPQADLAGALVAFDGGLAASVHREYLFVSDLAYAPARGTQTSAKLYGSIDVWYAEGVAGEDTFPTVWMVDMDGGNPRGMFHVGPEFEPYHGRKVGSYLFSVPQWYADQYLGGRTLVTGRSRGTPADGVEPVTTRGGSQGPTLFAFACRLKATPQPGRSMRCRCSTIG
jgi:hypothetical protein